MLTLDHLDLCIFDPFPHHPMLCISRGMKNQSSTGGATTIMDNDFFRHFDRDHLCRMPAPAFTPSRFIHRDKLTFSPRLRTALSVGLRAVWQERAAQDMLLRHERRTILEATAENVLAFDEALYDLRRERMHTATHLKAGELKLLVLCQAS